MERIEIAPRKEGSLTLALDMRWINDIEDVFYLAQQKGADISEQSLDLSVNVPFGVCYVTFCDAFEGMEVAYALLQEKETERSIMWVSDSLMEDIRLLDY